VSSAPADALVSVLTSSLSLTKTVSLGGACPGSSSVAITTGLTVTYCYAVTNTGGLAISGVTVSDAGAVVSIGDLAPGASGSGSQAVIVLSNADTPAVASGTDSTGASVVSPMAAAMVSVVSSSLGINPSCQPSGVYETINQGTENATCASGDGFTLDDALALCGADVNYFDYTCTDIAGSAREWTASFGCCVPAGGPSCSDGILNGTETDVDCGGQCPQACSTGQKCNVNPDCISDSCVDGRCAIPSVLNSTCTSDGNNVTLHSAGWPDHQDGICEGGFEGFTIFQAAANCASGQVKYFDYTCTDFALPPPYAPQRTWESDYACCVPDVCTVGGTVYTAGQPNPANPCQTCQPSVSTSAFTNIADGTACNDGNACTSNDVCTAGVCAGTPYTCAAPDQCHQAGTCNGDGTCSFADVADGTACNDGNACTQTDTCQAGVCTGGNPVVCNASDPCHVAGVCNPATGQCSTPNAPDGTACNDGNACTTNDVCTNGTCGGTAYSCAAPDQCHQAGTCNGDGTCSYANKADGTTCNDGNACTQTDTCQAGVCTGSNPVVCAASDQCHVAGTCNPSTGQCSNPNAPNGTTCNDGNACTQTDTCQAGVCKGSNPVVCTASDQCHVAGVCNPSTGTCSNPNAANGTACNDGNACTSNDVCTNGTCGGTAYSCAAPDQCHQAGTCNGDGTCSYANRANGTACNDGNACTSNDVCTGGVCGGTPYTCTPTVCQSSSTCDGNGGCTIVNHPSGTACTSDGNACTSDVCDGAGNCTHPAISCDDGNACTTDTCDPTSGCVHVAVSCDDQNPCTDDTCNPATGCVHTSNDANSCSDGNLCNGLETCQAGVCVPGQPFFCSCGDACTTSSCDPVHGCVYTPITNCSCGLVVGTPTAATNQVKVSVQETGAAAAVMDEVQINWPCANGALTQVKLDGAVVWQGSLACTGTAATITPATAGWTTNAANETISVGQTRQLTFQFQSPADTNVADYSWDVDFGGCPVKNNWSPPAPTCPSLPACTPAYPFTSGNPNTSVVFSESDVLEDAVWGFTNGGCAPTQIRVFYSDEHALSLGVRQVVVKTASGTTTTNYPIAATPSSPSSVQSPAVGSTIGSGDQAGADVSGRPLFPALFITDTTANPNSTAGDWQNGGTAIPPTAVFGVWKGAVRTVDHTTSPATVTVTPDADPPKNNWNLGAGADPVPAGLANEGYGAEVRWDLSQLGLLPGHSYRFYFMVHDGDQNKTGGDAGQACETLCLDANGNVCGSGPNVAIEKSAPAALSSEATSLPYTITVASNGTQTAPAVVMTDAVPAGVAFDSVSTTLGTCSFADGTVTCGFGDMAPGTTAVITILTTPIASGSVTNTATVTTTAPEPNTADNTSTATTSFFACNLVAGTPIAGPQPPPPPPPHGQPPPPPPPGPNQVAVSVEDGEASAVVLDQVQIAWPCTNGALTQVKLDSAVVWQGSLACTGAVATLTPASAGWTTNAANETISAGQTRQLTFQFQNNVDAHIADYSWNVDFGGCTVTSNWGQPGPTCPSLPVCTPAYPFTSANPLTSLVFSESDVLEDAVWGFTQGCAPTQIRVFYSDEHALSLGVRQVNVKTASGTTTTNYPIAALPQSPGSVLNPTVGSTIQGGDQAGVDVSGRPMFPALFITDTTADPNSTAGDWQYGGAAIPPTAVFGTWKGAVKTVDYTHTPALVTVTPDADPAKNNWSLGAGADPVPGGLANQGYGAEIRWDLSQLNLVPGHSYRFYFMVHDGDQNKTGGDVGQACESLCLDADGNICGSSGSSSSSSSSSSSGCGSGSSSSSGGSGSTCPSLPVCTPPYPFSSPNPNTSLVFSESEDLEAATVGFGGVCAPTQIRVFYSDEHALSLGVRQVNVKTTSGTTTTNYTIAATPSGPSSVIDPAVGSTIATGDQAGVDVSGRPLFPALFMTDVTGNPTSLAGDWQYGGTAIPPTAVFGTWKGAVKTVDYTHTPALVTVQPDADPPKNNWNLGTGADPVPSGLANQGYGAEIRWDLSQLNLQPGHTYRFYFMVHDGDQNKTGGDVGQGCEVLCIGPDGNLCSN
jgi:uncharacterized repeat protein (TIGR01451 family)